MVNTGSKTSHGESVSSLNAGIVEEARISTSSRGGFVVEGDALMIRGSATPVLPKLYVGNSSFASELF